MNKKFNAGNGPMETLDRRISASTDQLDTLKRDHSRQQNQRMWADDLDHSDQEDHHTDRLSRYNKSTKTI